MWKNIVEPDRPQLRVWHLHIAWCIPMATNTHSECVIFIASSLQQLLHEHVSVRCVYIACSVHFLTAVVLLLVVAVHRKLFEPSHGKNGHVAGSEK